MKTQEVTVGLKNGLEARAIAIFVQMACQYDSSIFVDYGSKKVNAKSIMGVMSLGVAEGDELTLTVEGPDEDEAIEAVADYLTNRQK